MHSIGHYILEMNSSMRVLYVTSEQFTNEVIESIRSGNATSMARLRDKYRTVDVLLIDDIQFLDFLNVRVFNHDLLILSSAKIVYRFLTLQYKGNLFLGFQRKPSEEGLP